MTSTSRGRAVLLWTAILAVLLASVLTLAGSGRKMKVRPVKGRNLPSMRDALKGKDGRLEDSP